MDITFGTSGSLESAKNTLSKTFFSSMLAFSSLYKSSSLCLHPKNSHIFPTFFWVITSEYRCCQKARNGAMPVPGPTNTIGFNGSLGRLKLGALQDHNCKAFVEMNYIFLATFVRICINFHLLWRLVNNLNTRHNV